jgi:hypothetical protein
MQKLALILFLLGLFVTGLLGTETRLLFFWPGCALIGLAGLLAVLRWKLRVSFQPSDWCLLTVRRWRAMWAGGRGFRRWRSMRVRTGRSCWPVCGLPDDGDRGESSEVAFGHRVRAAGARGGESDRRLAEFQRPLGFSSRAGLLTFVPTGPHRRLLQQSEPPRGLPVVRGLSRRLV